jgi:cytochrome P450
MIHTDAVAAPTSPPDLLSLFDPSVRADPYPLYEQVRAVSPVPVAGGLVTVFAGFDDCEAVLRHPEARSDRRRSAVFARVAASPGGLPWGEQKPPFLFLDPPDHTRLRRLVSQAFTARRVERLRPAVRELVTELLEAAGEEPEIVEDLAYPLPLTVIADLLGVPREDAPRLREWSVVLTRALDPSIALTGRPPEGIEQRVAVMEEFRGYFTELTDRRRREPRDDLLSALVAAEDQGDRLSTEELLTTCVLLLVAGHETTVNLIANGVLALVRHPEQLALLAADPELAPGTVEEVLRYDPPVQLTARVAGEDLAVGGVRLEPGSLALLLLAAAGRDPAANPDPDTFDIRRPSPRHVAFGHGIHFCLGAPLARLEAQLALAEFARRFPAGRLADEEVRYRDTITLRGLAELRVRAGG